MFPLDHPNKSLKKVFNGDFPEEHLKRMGKKRLESFVLKLVECSSDVGAKNPKSFTGLYRGLCLNEINKPEWWPSEKIIEKSLTKDGKYFMQFLRYLVFKCCEFFKKPCENLNNELFVNDENSRTGVKRKCDESDNGVPSKRRTLMPKNNSSSSSSVSSVPEENVIKSPVICLRDILYTPKPKPLTQDAFLNALGLQSITHCVEETQVPHISSASIKFNNCSIIPFSSDLGKELMKRDNHVFPEHLKHRKLERFEWYTNQLFPRNVDINFPVSYQEKRDLTFHCYKFPKRQFSQHPSKFDYDKMAQFCRPLSVMLVRDDLDAMKKDLILNSNCELKVVVPRMSLNQVQKDSGIMSLAKYRLRPRGKKKIL